MCKVWSVVGAFTTSSRWLVSISGHWSLSTGWASSLFFSLLLLLHLLQVLDSHLNNNEYQCSKIPRLSIDSWHSLQLLARNTSSTCRSLMACVRLVLLGLSCSTVWRSIARWSTSTRFQQHVDTHFNQIALTALFYYLQASYISYFFSRCLSYAYGASGKWPIHLPVDLLM